MQISSTQLFLILAWLYCNNGAVVNRKRSPLEVGYVHFPQIKLKAKLTNSSLMETKPLDIM
ncbi:PREDICTED: uncharacterized protein LOC108559338 isoform X2 [Nicrophorus vespilloides]|uniref:Uncharacterized protein LOC108559338 isoform X2 n=1 Tax=Nicrophorus vespilloides TaxID=110193 RepID=A0ABM1MBX2_NICVS|nr:PREDICTED: uncharacterized protein LOC108559338 isoform X2 [Nicrophorus vespilloides]